VSRELLTHFDGLYQSKVGAKYPVNGGKDGKLLKDLRAIYSDADITRFMDAFFKMDDPFFAEAGWSLGCFRSCLPKVIAYVNRKGSVAINWKTSPIRPTDRARADISWEGHECPHGGTCATPGICQFKSSAERRQRGEVA
jgi:hypothetical protein